MKCAVRSGKPETGKKKETGKQSKPEPCDSRQMCGRILHPSQRRITAVTCWVRPNIFSGLEQGVKCVGWKTVQNKGKRQAMSVTNFALFEVDSVRFLECFACR